MTKYLTEQLREEGFGGAILHGEGTAVRAEIVALEVGSALSGTPPPARPHNFTKRAPLTGEQVSGHSSR